MSDDSEKGQVEAHTQASTSGAAPEADGAAAIDGADHGDQAHGLFDGRDVADLLSGSPDLGDTDLLAMAAELSAGPRRGRGRPAGSPNRKNAEMISYLAALGHRDPWVTISLIQTADTRSLAMALRSPVRHKNGSPVKDADGKIMLQAPDYAGTLALQLQAASRIMDHHHAKMPQQLELGGAGDKVPWMAIGEMTVNVMGGPLDGVMSAGEVIEGEKANEINDRPVRPNEGRSHANAKPLKTNDDSA